MVTPLNLAHNKNPPENGHTPKPFLKWAGGKRALLPKLKNHMPDNYRLYYEPFLGGGALFFSEQPQVANLSDINEELMNCYIQIRKSPYEVIDALKPLKYDLQLYYEVRKWKPIRPVERAARFIYLNRCCWNGLWRVNNKGEFNVPFGRYNNPVIYNEKVIVNASRALQFAHLSVGDFVENSKKAEINDFVYFDPPYTIKHGNNGFLSYNEKIFSWEDQERLAKHARKLAERGVKVMISNANARDIINLYEGFNIYKVERMSTISGAKRGRGKVSELIITSY